jgi:hypothetical protein
MDSSKSPFRIELTAEQKAQVRSATGMDAEAVELSIEELEQARWFVLGRSCNLCAGSAGLRAGASCFPSLPLSEPPPGRHNLACPTY